MYHITLLERGLDVYSSRPTSMITREGDVKAIQLCLMYSIRVWLGSRPHLVDCGNAKLLLRILPYGNGSANLWCNRSHRLSFAQIQCVLHLWPAWGLCSVEVAMLLMLSQCTKFVLRKFKLEIDKYLVRHFATDLNHDNDVRNWRAYLYKEDSINHEADIILSDSSLTSNWNGNLLEGMHICYLVYLWDKQDVKDRLTSVYTCKFVNRFFIKLDADQGEVVLVWHFHCKWWWPAFTFIFSRTSPRL